MDNCGNPGANTCHQRRDVRKNGVQPLLDKKGSTRLRRQIPSVTLSNRQSTAIYGLSESLLLPPPRLRKKPGGIDSKFNVDYELFMPQAEKLVSGGQNRDFRHFSSFFK